MIDIHSHIIYGIDDGARTIEEAIQMIRMDSSFGVTDIIATPHYYVSRPTDPDQIHYRLNNIEKTIAEMNDKQPVEAVSVRLYPGNEVLWFESMPEKLKSGAILTLAGTRYTLVEFYPDQNIETMLQAVRKLRYSGYIPVIAHAERYAALRANGAISELIRQGAQIQLSTGAFSGGFFDKEAKFVKKAVKDDLVHYMGTDMHRTDRRAPDWSAAIRYIRKTAKDPDALLFGNAAEILGKDLKS